MTDNVNHPKHYNTNPSGVECITVVRHMNFNRGNAIKYTWRAGEKGNEIEDLEKAVWYLKDEINRIKMLALQTNVSAVKLQKKSNKSKKKRTKQQVQRLSFVSRA